MIRPLFRGLRFQRRRFLPRSTAGRRRGKDQRSRDLPNTAGATSTFQTDVKAAIKRLTGSTGEGAGETKALLEQARTADAKTRANLISGLSTLDIDQREALPSLTAWAMDPDRDVRSAACETLVLFGRVAVPAVIPLLSSHEPRDVINAARILGQIGLEPEMVVPALTKKLSIPDSDVKEKLAEALGKFGANAESSVPDLVRLLSKTTEISLQKTIAYTFGEIGSGAKEAVPQLIEFVTSTKDPEGFLNVIAAEALGKIGPAAGAAVPVLTTSLRSDDPRLPTSSAEALGNMGARAESAMPDLVVAIRSAEKEYRANYAEPLGRIAAALAAASDTRSIPALKKTVAALESGNVEQKFILPVQEALDSLNDRVSRSKDGESRNRSVE